MKTILEAGIAKFPAGRSPDEASAEAEAAYGRAPTNEVFRIGKSVSLEEVNALELAPGATVLFERGGVWRGQLRARSGIPGHPVRYGAFGEGPAPVLQPSHDAGGVDRWTDEGGGLWSAASGARADIGNVILDGGESGCLFKRGTRAELLRDGDFFFDSATAKVFIRSEAGNPGTRWRTIELAEKIHGIDQGGVHDVAYDSLDIRYSAAHGIGGGCVKRIVIRNCGIFWIGGGYLYTDNLGNGVRYGNGIELWGGAEDVLVENCRVSQCWDAGLTNQSSMPGSIQRNIVWRGNFVERCEYSYEFWQQGKDGVAENIRLEGNDFRDAGFGWGHAQRWNPNAAHLMLYDTTTSTPGFAIVGNRFSRSANVMVRAFNDWGGEALFQDNVWEADGAPLCRCHGRPRAGLRFLYPDHLDQIHCDDEAEIEAQSTSPGLFRDHWPW